MKPSDILNRAAEIIIETGKWNRGDLQLGHELGVDRHCMMTAIGTAASTWIDGTKARKYVEQVVGGGVAAFSDDNTEATVLGALHEAALLAKADGR